MASDPQAPQSDDWTIGRLLAWTTDFFARHEIDQPRLEAEVLLAFARGCERIDLYAAFGDLASETLRTRFRELVSQRAAGTPVAYLVGYREFFSLRFVVTPDVLIPRPETEHLVVAAIDFLKQHPAAAQVADIGTGSGAIAVCIARANQACHVTAVDSSPAALQVAAENVRRHAVDSQVTLAESDLLATIETPRQFDLLVSNPPYVATSEYESLPADVKDHEPRQALVAGERGTEVIQRITAIAGERLVAGGMLLVEISPMIEAACRQMLESSAGVWEHVRFIPDLAGHARVLQATRSQ